MHLLCSPLHFEIQTRRSRAISITCRFCSISSIHKPTAMRSVCIIGESYCANYVIKTTRNHSTRVQTQTAAAQNSEISRSQLRNVRPAGLHRSAAATGTAGLGVLTLLPRCGTRRPEPLSTNQCCHGIMTRRFTFLCCFIAPRRTS